MFLGLNWVLLYMNYLLLQLEQSGAVEVSANRKSLKDQIIVTSTIYSLFFFLKEKGKSCRDSDHMSVKTKIV